MTHKERRRWVGVIARMNQEMNESNIRAYQQRLEQLKNEQQAAR